MRRSVRAISLILFVPTALAAGESDLRGARDRFEATVDSSGKVIPGRQVSGAVERLSESAPVHSPCATSPISREAARSLVEQIAREENFYPDFVVAVARAESDFRSDALSPKGAVGLMQITRDTAERYQVDICDPSENVRGGIRFLRDLHGRYHNPLFILAAYNAGEAALAEHGGVPPYPETVKFVADVLNDFYDWEKVVKTHGPKAAHVAANRIERNASHSRRGEVGTSDERWKSGFVWNAE
ncbi:lytic transglycosylase domain-containing protein [Methylosinus sp. H3A]|nr:lytic transglycosylase domain-containing protein [Methylosinus sp. H3A]